MLRKSLCTVLVTLATICTVWLGPAPVREARAEMIGSAGSQEDHAAARLARDRELVRMNLQAIGMSPTTSMETVDRLKPHELQVVAAMPGQLRTAGTFEGAVVVGVILLILLAIYICAREEDPMTQNPETPREAELRRATSATRK
jgi:hypothetical protein